MGGKENSSPPKKEVSGTKAQLDAAAKSKGMTPSEYKADLEKKGYTVIVK